MLFKRGFWLLFLLTTVHASSAMAQPRGLPPSPPDFSKLPFAEELDLTEAQKAQIKTLHEANREEFKKYRQKMQESKQRFDEAMDADLPDKTTRGRFQEMQQAHDAMMAFGFEQALAIRKILTPEQRKKFQKLRDEKFKKGPHHGHGPMGPGPDCPPPGP